jgi:hypothetical protein
MPRVRRLYYWNHFMHVRARIEDLRVHARIPKLGIFVLVSRDERALHLLALTVG